MALSDLQKMVVGMFSPGQAPANASIYDLARADAQRQAMARLGMGLVGAAVPQTPAMRAQALQQAFGGLGDINTSTYNSAQARLMARQIEDAEATRAADAAWNERFSTLGVPQVPQAAVVQPVEPVGEFREIPASARRLVEPMPPTASPEQAPVTQVAQNASGLNEFGLTNEQYKWVMTQPPSARRDLTEKLAIANLKEGGMEYGDPKEIIRDGKRVLARFPKNGGKEIIVGEAPTAPPEGWGEYDKKVAVDIKDWTMGGRGVSAAQMSNLQFVERLAQDNPNITGPAVGLIDAAGVLKFANPQAEAAKNTVHQIALTQIRAVAGAQFTENEARDFLNRAWNPALPLSENMRRVRIMGEQLKQAAEEKDRQSEFFFKNGTMRGYQPKIGTSTAALLADFNERIGFDPRTEPMFIDPNPIIGANPQQPGTTGQQPSNPNYNPADYGITPTDQTWR